MKRKLRGSHGKTKKTRLQELIEGNVAYHGNYVGPGWSAGQYQTSVATSDVPAIDEFDETAKQHDSAYALAQNQQDLQDADETFIRSNVGKGIKRRAAAELVRAQSIKRSKKLRGASDLQHRSLSNYQTPEKKTEQALSISPETKTTEPLAVGTTMSVPVTTGPGMGETPVMEVPRNRITYRPWRDTMTVTSPFNFRYRSVVDGYTKCSYLCLRMNSVYDIIANSTSEGTAGASMLPGADIGTKMTDTFVDTEGSIINIGGSASNINQNLQGPAWRDYFASLYGKYHVIDCYWEVQTKMISGHTSDMMGCFMTMYGNENRPDFTFRTTDQLMYWEDIENVRMLSPPQDTGRNTLGGMVQTIDGYYKQGMINHDVREDANATVWTNKSSNPARQEYLYLIHGLHPLSSSEQTIGQSAFQTFVTLKFTVQWKDLDPLIRYPTSTFSKYYFKYNEENDNDGNDNPMDTQL